MKASVKNILKMHRVSRRSQRSSDLRRGSAAARLLMLWFRVPLIVWKSVSCECCVLSGRGLRVGLITRPEKTH